MPIPLLAMAIGAGIGAAAGGFSTMLTKNRQQTDLNRQKDMAADAYRYKQQYEDASFNLQRGEALAQLGIARNRLAEAFGADIAGFNLGLEGQALANQSARVSLGEGAGAALAAQGASGTRGSDSLSMQIGFHETQFARQTDLQDRGNSLAVQNMARQYTNQFDDIGREIDSWNPGGYRYEAKGLSDTYSANMYGLTERGFEHAQDDMNNWQYNTLDYLTAVLGGAAQGAGFGGMVGGLSQQAGGSGGSVPAWSGQSGYSQYGGNAFGQYTPPPAYGAGLNAPRLDPRFF